MKIKFATFFAAIFLIPQISIAKMEPYFSPDGGFLDKITTLITTREAKTIDISIYSFGSPMIAALKNAKRVNPNLEVRVIFDRSNASRKPEAVTQLEDMGIDVRTVSKTNHHKFIIVNGVHCKVIYGDTCSEDPIKTKIFTGSGNFNRSADSDQDEAFTYIDENIDLAKHFSLEFAWLWNHSKELGKTILPEKLETKEGTTLSEQYEEDVRAVFTHKNYDPRGVSFKTNGNKVVSSKIIEFIEKAEHSIKIAHAHFQMKDVAKAIEKKIKEKQNDPLFKVQIYLDGQNYKGKSSFIKEYKKLQACLGEKDCGDQGIHWYWPLMYPAYVNYPDSPNSIFNSRSNNVDLRFKYYMFRWEYSKAKQMHSKYIIIDDEILLTGSYNLSLTSEQSCFENVTLYRKYNSHDEKTVVDAFVQNFKNIWSRNRDKISTVKEMIGNGATFWSKYPLSVSYDEIEELFDARRGQPRKRSR